MTLILGCMKLGDQGGAEAAIEAALAIGITRLDTADIYGAGASERAIGAALAAHPSWRSQLSIQTKFGIRPGDPTTYRQDGDYVRASVEGSLKRLGVDRIDSLLIHRPDPLADYFATGSALMRLMEEGTIGRVGVSNMHEHQIALWQRVIPVSANQIELSLAHHAFVDVDVDVNRVDQHHDFPTGLLPYCMTHGIEIQAYSPLAGGVFSGAAGGPENMTGHALADTRACVARIAAEMGAEPAAVVLAWLLRHPAGIVPVVGSAKPERIATFDSAARLCLSREQWYELYVAARGRPLP